MRITDVLLPVVHQLDNSIIASPRKATLQLRSADDSCAVQNSAWRHERRLALAVSLNNVELVKKLLEAGVNPSCSDSEGRTPLHLASSRGFTEIVKVLLDKGANPNMRDILGNTPLHLAVCTSEIAVVTMLLKAGTDVNCSDHSGRSPLQLAQTKLKIIQHYGRCTHSQKLRNDVMQVCSEIFRYFAADLCLLVVCSY
ncbi:hypothetical protein PR048_021606 [Dryococelus australis]|uniref:Uncharacterized protein n=1 Tax=Dryococelus australis TaxID=614101 RepID=A0ABQ9GYN9_9NEOP|nr:hypothetical protein PR048_021606 [Dryococelus australis]